MRARARTLLLALLLAAGPGPAAIAAETARSAPQSAAVSGAGALNLAGCAARRFFVFDVYHLRLYLPRRPAHETVAFDRRLPKMVELEVTYPGNVPGDMPGSWRKRFQERLPPALIADLRSIYRNLRGGDVLSIDYRPERGSLVRLNGAVQIADHGPELIEALLDIWMGPRALHPEIRQQLLSGRC
ncbi:MAG TPA: chalcone isomerase family protein [Azospirillum sp.]|nr:chalcone isomerase family protein [Azospirillum sp.]